MISDENVTAFINAIDPGNTPFLEELYAEAVRNRIPVIRPEMQCFLKTLLFLRKPRAILEIGTAVGFSAALMAEYTPEDCRITTIENYNKRIAAAKENFARSGHAARIELIEGDAAEILTRLEGPYDLIFLDAAKGQYIRFLPKLKRLLGRDGILLSDNVLQDGSVCQSRYLVERRDRTIHKRLRDYLFALKAEEDWQTSILPISDGVTMSVWKRETET